MHPRLIAALSISALLIGGATWQRVERSSGTVTAPALAVVADASSPTVPDQAPATLPEQTATTSEKLTDTNLIARQLFTQYVSLSANGQATPANLASLGTQYADNIASLDKSPKIGSGDLRTVPDSKQNMQAYADALTLIYAKYRALQASALSGASAITSTGKSFDALSLKLSDLYARQAQELKNMSVPSSLAQDQLALVNIYLGNAWGTKVMTQSDQDSATSFAGAFVTNSNLTAEAGVIQDIEKILTQNGI